MVGGSKDGGEARDIGGFHVLEGVEAAARGTPASRLRSPPLAAETWSAVRSWGLWPGGRGHRVRPRGGERTVAAHRCGDLRLFRASPARLLEAQKSSISGSRVSPEAGHRPSHPCPHLGHFPPGPAGAALTLARTHTLVCTQRRTHPWTHTNAHAALNAQHKRRPGRTKRLVSLPAGAGHSPALSVWVWPRTHL